MFCITPVPLTNRFELMYRLFKNKRGQTQHEFITVCVKYLSVRRILHPAALCELKRSSIEPKEPCRWNVTCTNPLPTFSAVCADHEVARQHDLLITMLACVPPLHPPSSFLSSLLHCAPSHSLSAMHPKLRQSRQTGEKSTATQTATLSC